MSTEVPDGATQRHSRMMELLTFINLTEPHGPTVTSIQSHMLKVYGLKFKTAGEMVRELSVAGSLKVDGHGFPADSIRLTPIWKIWRSFVFSFLTLHWLGITLMCYRGLNSLLPLATKLMYDAIRGQNQIGLMDY